MEEKEILLKTIEGLNASIASLSTTNKNQSEQIKNLQERIKELTAQVAWLNRQLFGRKSEKLRVYDPNMGSPDKPGGLSIQLCKSEKKEFYIRYSS